MAKKDEEMLGRESYGGSVYDQHYFSDSELAAAADARAAAEAGKTSWDDAHAFVENIRAGYGYSGESDGGKYVPLAKETQPERETFTYESAPSYTNKYKGKIDALTEAILGREAFTYDPETDPTYQQYKESYTRSGQRAMQDTIGQVSARTGGLASSYAQAAGQQAYDGYMSALADKIPELKQLAYSMYQDEGEQQRANLEMLMALEQGDYNKYLNLLGQHNTDRSFDYGVFSDDRAYDYQAGRDNIADQRYDQQYADSREDNQYAKDLQKAQTLAAAGDFSGYTALGYSDAEIGNLQAGYKKAQAGGRTGGGGGGSNAGGSGGDTGILAAMYALGDDAAAYEYLVGQGLSNDKSSTLWDLYQNKGQTQSTSYQTVLSTAAGYKNDDQAKSYLERMVDGGYITPDEAAYIYQVELGAMSQPGTGVPTTYEEFSAITGNPSIMTSREFSRARGTGRTAGYTDYQDYLAKMYDKYKK